MTTSDGGAKRVVTPAVRHSRKPEIARILNRELIVDRAALQPRKTNEWLDC